MVIDVDVALLLQQQLAEDLGLGENATIFEICAILDAQDLDVDDIIASLEDDLEPIVLAQITLLINKIIEALHIPVSPELINIIINAVDIDAIVAQIIANVQVSLGILEECLDLTTTTTTTTPPPPTTETLTIIKNVDCQADPTTCANNPIQPSNFTIVIDGNNPIPDEFSGESCFGTEVQIGSGRYNVTEQGLDPNTSGYKLCQFKGFDAGKSLGNNLFIYTNFSDDGCDGDITVVSPQTCTVDNVLISCEVTVQSNLITGFSRASYIEYNNFTDTIYVATWGDNPDTVSVINTTTNTEIDTDGDPSNGITPIQLPAGGSGPYEFAHDPFHNRMYVTIFNGLSTSVHVIDTTTFAVIDTDGDPSNGITPITVGREPFGIAFDGVNRMFVTNFLDSTVSVINIDTFAVIDTDGDPSNGITPIQLPVSAGIEPTYIEYDPDLKRMYVIGGFQHGTVSVIDTDTYTVIDTDGDPSNGITSITVGDFLRDITYDPINRDMYVNDQGGNTVFVIDTDTNTVIDTDGDPSNGITSITVGREPFGIEYDPIHHRMYVGSLNWSTVSVINLC